MSSPPNLSLDLANTSVVVTGGAGLIGQQVVAHFLAAGARVASLDIAYEQDETREGPAFAAIRCDVTSEESVERAFARAADAHGPAAVCVALASLDLSVLAPSDFCDASFGQLRRVLDVNVGGTWLTARAWMRGLRLAKTDGVALRHPNLIIVGSESGHFGERRNVEYALGKSAVQGGMLMSLRAEAPRVWAGARVNVVAPGPVETERWKVECEERPEQWWEEARATVSVNFLSFHGSSSQPGEGQVIILSRVFDYQISRKRLDDFPAQAVWTGIHVFSPQVYYGRCRS
jgi:NAD(P)-dependent dehydrogenase (short-subunit alcohol dehydrogenase family)